MPIPVLVLAVIAQLQATPDPVSTYGPWAILTGVIGTLWKLHLDGDTRDRAQRDLALAGWAAQENGNRQLADVIEKRLAAIERRLTAIEQKLERKA